MTWLFAGTCFCRWNEVTRRIEMWISILELNELGEYAAVELHQAKDVNTGGVFQLRQVLGLPQLASCFLPVPFSQFLERSSSLPFPLSSSPVPPGSHSRHPFPHRTPASAGSFPESPSHSEACPAFRDTAAHGRSHLVHLHRLHHCQVNQAPERVGQLPGETNRFEAECNKDWLIQN